MNILVYICYKGDKTFAQCQKHNHNHTMHMYRCLSIQDKCLQCHHFMSHNLQLKQYTYNQKHIQCNQVSKQYCHMYTNCNQEGMKDKLMNCCNHPMILFQLLYSMFLKQVWLQLMYIQRNHKVCRQHNQSHKNQSLLEQAHIRHHMVHIRSLYHKLSMHQKRNMLHNCHYK